MQNYSLSLSQTKKSLGYTKIEHHNENEKRCCIIFICGYPYLSKDNLNEAFEFLKWWCTVCHVLYITFYVLFFVSTVYLDLHNDFMSVKEVKVSIFIIQK